MGGRDGRKGTARVSAKNVNILQAMNRRDRGTLERVPRSYRRGVPARLECHFNYSENDSRVPLHVRR